MARRSKSNEHHSGPRAEGEVILVDGSNIAYEKPHRDRPDLQNVWRVEKALRELGYRPMTVIDASLRWKLHGDQAKELESRRHEVIQAPAGVPADRTLLEYAQRRELRVVSNDRFRPYEEKYPWIKDPGRRIPYNLIEDQVLLYFHEPGLDPRVVPVPPAPATVKATPKRVPARPIRPPTRARLQRRPQTTGSIPLPPAPKRAAETRPIRRRTRDTAVRQRRNRPMRTKDEDRSRAR